MDLGASELGERTMPFQVRTEKRPTASALDATIYILEDSTGSARAEIWPALGFNCFHWSTIWCQQQLNLLYADPQLFQDGRPTRSGIPILFPFPNRIRAGRFTWAGKQYSLPLNDGPKKNASHGFVCRLPWRVVGQSADSQQASLVGEFRGSVDAPDCAGLWPADYTFRLTYRLLADRLRLEAHVTNPDHQTLPFGLGYHPYFQVPLIAGGNGEDCQVEVKAARYWELEDSLPTGKRLPVHGGLDLNHLRHLGDLKLDDILTDLPTMPAAPKGLFHRATLREAKQGVELRLFCSATFREMVVFNPAHRQAFCIEPYTCPTDAINLQQEGLDAGWLALQPGETWESVVELVVS
jgi:aldose 1-epimerase